MQIKTMSLPLFFLSTQITAFFLFLLIHFYSISEINELQEWVIFCEFWLLAVPAAILLSFMLRRLAEKHAGNADIVLRPLSVSLSIILFLATSTTRLADVFLAHKAGWLLTDTSGIWLMYGIPGLFIASYIGLTRYRNIVNADATWWIFTVVVLSLISIILLSVPDINRASYLWQAAIISMLVALLFHNRFTYYVCKLIGDGPKDWIFLGTVSLFVLSPLFVYDIHHHNFLLGPTLALMHGKTVLVDTFSQYGVLLFYFLKGVFSLEIIPFSYGGLAFVVMFLNFALYIFVYILLRKLLRSQFLAMLGLISVVVANYFAVIVTPSNFPATGALRFGLPFLIYLPFLLLKKDKVTSNNVFYFQCVIVGIASIWSFETFFYTAIAFAAYVVYRNAQVHQTMRPWMLAVTKQAGFSFLMILIAHIGYETFVFFKTGQWASWSTYFLYILKYSPNGMFSVLPVPRFGPWIFIMVILIVSVIASLFSLKPSRDKEEGWKYSVIFSLAAMGIAQSTYYLGRSHPNNLLHIVIPVIISGFFWIQFVVSRNRKLGNILLFVTYAFIASVLIAREGKVNYKMEISTINHLYKTLTKQASVYSFACDRWTCNFRYAARTAKMRRLVDKYLAKDERILMFLSGEETTVTMLELGRAHWLPITHLGQDMLNVKVIELIKTKANEVAAGRYIFRKRYIDGAWLFNDILGQLCSKFYCRVVESTEDGFDVIKLVEKDNMATNENRS